MNPNCGIQDKPRAELYDQDASRAVRAESGFIMED